MTTSRIGSADRIRVATLQYFIRPINSMQDFRQQVAGLVDTARDYRCELVVFPEYFTTQLLTLGDTHKPIREQIYDLARQLPNYMEIMSELAKKRRIYIVGGSIPVIDPEDGKVYNECFIFNPDGNHGVQGKLQMTRFEAEEWFVQPRTKLKVFETAFGRIAVAICYDIQFPEIARAAAYEGAQILIVPSCTDDRQGFLRVRYCAQARAVENQMYVIQSSTVGSLPMVPAVSLNYGQASILTPSDFPFARDGILAEGIPNQETMVIGEINLRTLEEARTSGTVLSFRDSQKLVGMNVKPVVEKL